MLNETRSTKQDDVKDVAEDEPSIELEMDCQSEDDDTINHHADEEPQQERRERCPPDRYGEWVYYLQEEKLLEVSGYLNKSTMLMETLKKI